MKKRWILPLTIGLGIMTSCGHYEVKEEFNGPSFMESREEYVADNIFTQEISLDSYATEWTYGARLTDGVAEDEQYAYLRNPRDGRIYGYTEDGKQSANISGLPGDGISNYKDRLFCFLPVQTGAYAAGIYVISKEKGTQERFSASVPASMMIVNDWIYYIDSHDRRLYKINCDTKDSVQLSDENTENFLVLENNIYCTQYIETDDNGISWYAFRCLDVNGDILYTAPYLYTFHDFIYTEDGFLATDYVYNEILKVAPETLLAEVLVEGVKLSMPAKQVGDKIYFIDEQKNRTLAAYDQRKGIVMYTRLQDVTDFSCWRSTMILYYVQNGMQYCHIIKLPAMTDVSVFE